MLEELGDDVKEEEVKEGMQHSHHHDHEDEDHDHKDHDHEDHDDVDHDHEDEDHDHDHEDGEKEYDEHVWLSLKNAEELTEKITDKLETLTPDLAADIAANCDSYVAELDKLDSEYEAAVEASPIKTIIFGDRFPFRYLVDDYDLDYYAAFVGCSAETEASFETISFLTNKVDELHVPAILTIENSDQKVAKTILNNTKSKNQQILVMDSLQSVSQETIDGGKTYLGTMQDNLETLKVALGVNA
jgi:zinc transport system substrate-binding protein